MKRRILFLFLIFSSILYGQNNIYRSGGITQTIGAPTFTPGVSGNVVAIDTVTGEWYVNPNRLSGLSWISAGYRLTPISGSIAPVYTPAAHQSHFVINGANTIYYWTGSAWVNVNAGGGGNTFYAGEGIDITNDTITNSAPDQTVSITNGGGITPSGTYPNFTLTATDQSITNEIQRLDTFSLSGQTLSASLLNDAVAASTVTLPIIDVVAGTNVTVSKANGIATVSSTGGGGSGTVTGTGVAGRAAFWRSTSAISSDANFAWDSTNVRLNIRSALSSSAALSVRGGSDLSSSFSFVAGNNSGTEFFRVRNDGVINARGNYIQLGTDQNVGIGPTTNGGGFASNGGDVIFAGSNSGANNTCAAFNIVGGRKLASSGTLWINGGLFDPTTGSDTYSIIDVKSSVVINQTGTATGITRGINITPTLTAAPNYRAIDWNNNTGYGLYGTGTANNYLAGNTVIGTTTPSARLHSRGSNASSGTNAFLVQNSTPDDIYKIENNGKITYWATNTAAGTTAPQTIDKPSGTINFAAADVTKVVTNALCTTSSIVFATVRTNDATAYIKNVVPGSGSFTINLGAAATAETSVGFFIIN